MRKIVVGAGRLAKKFPQLKETFRTIAKEEIAQGVSDIARTARINAPYLSGELADSIGEFLSKDGLAGGVAANAPHARAVELGTEDTAAQPYLFPAAEAERKRIVRRTGNRMRKAAKAVAAGNGTGTPQVGQ